MKNFTQIKNITVLLLLFLTYCGVNAQTTTQTFTTSGTFTVPPGVTTIQVEAWGGGGAGGGTTNAARATGGGGAGGTYTLNSSVAVTPGQVITVTVGAGGVGVSNANGGAGGTSTFASTIPVTAAGGGGGARNTGATNLTLNGAGAIASVGVTRNGGSGGTGNATTSTSGNSGGGGGGAGATGNGGNASGITAGTGGTGGGGNGAAGRNSDGDGIDATALSGGGGGARSSGTGANRAGGDGYRGQIIVTYPTPEIDVRGLGNSIADGDATPSVTDNTDFGASNIGVGITKTFTVHNTGASASLTIGTITFGGTNPGDFAVTTLPSSPVTVGNSTSFVVTFTPGGAGTRSATISIPNNDSNEAPYDFTIQGTGNGPEMNVQGNATTIADGDATPTTADWTDFGSVTVANSGTRTFTIQNIGNQTLNIGAITIGGANAGEFTVTTLPAATLAAGASTTFVVTFIPGATGTRSATISIANDDSDENPYNYSIQGTGASNTAEIEIRGNLVAIVDADATPNQYDGTEFGGATVGSTISRTYTIYNSGSATLYIGGVTFTGANASDFTVTSAPPATIATSSNATFEITFTPGATGLRTATFSLVNSDSNENTYDFAIQGTGQTPLTYGPGGVTTPLQLWLRSDLLNGTTGVADGSAVNTWYTQARGTDAVKPAAVGAPIYRNNATHNVNFNAMVDFTNNYTTAPQVYTDNDATRQYLKGTSGFYSHDIYVMLMPDVTQSASIASNDIFCGDRNAAVQETDATGIGYSAYTSRMVGEVLTYAIGTSSGVGLGYGVADRSSNTYSTPGIINARNNSTITGTDLTFNANNVINHTTDAGLFTNITDMRYWIGRSEGWDGSLEARVGEIITLNKRATDIEKSNIQSYLAIKYGITLGVNGTSMNYTNSDGNVIWDATANSGFNYDIAGIGQDDISRLNQKQSKSVNPTEVMTIGLTDIYATNTANTNSFATNKSYLVWGANGGTMVDSGVNLNIDLGPTTITTITEVVNRKWKLVETGGDVGTVRVSIPTASFTSGLPALGANDAYVMVVATNSSFTTGLETVFMSTTGGNQTCLYDFDGTKYISFGVAHQAVNPLHITLDGIDDFVKIDNVNEISSAFTIMTWIRPNGANTLGSERTILAKKAASTSGYQLVLQNDNKVRIEWTVSGTTYSAVTNTAIPNGIWHNIAVSYGSNTLNMYIDGVLDRTATITTAPVSTTAFFCIGAQYVDKLNINNLFKGDIDELRMWNKVVTITEIRYIMNQEILQNVAGTRGTVMPTTVTKNDINTLNWNNLYAYYSMNSYIGTHLDDDSYNINRGSLVIPDKVSINQQTAPMPYISTASGLWSNTATWVNGSIQELPHSLSIVDGVTPIDWNIVRTQHNVDSSGNKTLLGLFVDANTLTASNDTKIEVSHYLKLDGKIDLSGRSQLIQTLNSDLDPTSSGSLERDQQGQSSRFNYNYWSSPVGTINNTTNNNTFTVNGVMRDGTTSTPQNITWTSGINGSPTTPITLSSYWIFKFQNLNGTYANWQSVGQNGTLSPAQGFTMKGSSAASPDQNYTFVGKPNNGTITTTVGANNLNLSGNPYASALDAHAFIDANVASITGTLYFYEHFASNTTHNVMAYQGGYGQLTKVGGTAPVTYPGLSGLGSSSKIPGRYIPVGQGFFIAATATGGTVTFNNDQRAFFKENNALSNTLFRNNANSILSVDHFNDNTEDSVQAPENFKKVRLGFTDHNGYHRQTLLGFMNEHATSAIDLGYDAVHIDSQPNDMYFMHGTTKLNIVGDGHFDYNNYYPLSVKTDAAGTITFKIDDKENFDDTVGFYIYDGLTNIYHTITDQDFSIDVPQGTIDNRFKLTFKQVEALSTAEFGLSEGILVAHTSANSMLNIKNMLNDATVEKVSLYNILGQCIKTWSVDGQDQQHIQLPVQSLATGTYIVRVKTDKGEISKKTIIN